MKLTGDCPHCKKSLAFDVDKLDIKQEAPLSVPNASATGQQTQQIEKPKEEPPKLKRETVIEDFKPNYECPNGDCDVGVHKNKNFTKRPKGKCTNCDQFTKHDSGTCPWCKKDEIEPIDSEELDELGIAKPPEQEYEGHDHE